MENAEKSGTLYPKISLNVGRIVNLAYCVRGMPVIGRGEITSGRCKDSRVKRVGSVLIVRGKVGLTSIGFDVASAGGSGAPLEAAFSLAEHGVNHVLSRKFGS